MFGPPSIGLVPTAPDWPAWVGHMVTTHFDLVSGLSWAPGGPKRAPFGPKCPLALNFHGPILCGNFFSKYRLVGCPEHRSGMLCSSSTVIAHIEPPSLIKRSKRGKMFTHIVWICEILRDCVHQCTLGWIITTTLTFSCFNPCLL